MCSSITFRSGHSAITDLLKDPRDGLVELRALVHLRLDERSQPRQFLLERFVVPLVIVAVLIALALKARRRQPMEPAGNVVS